MITLDAFLIFLVAASLPVTYLWIVSRWVEREYRARHAAADAPTSAAPVSKPLLTKAA